MGLTSAAQPWLANRPTLPDQPFKITGTGIDVVSLGVEAELTSWRGELITVDTSVTRGSASPSGSNSPLLSAIEAIQGGRLTPPNDLEFLLTQAVAARESRRGEDVTAWSQRLADEAARADS